MFTTKEKIALVIAGAELVVCGIGAIYCYGKAQYHKGRLDMAKEFAVELERIENELVKRHSNEIEA